MLVVIAGVCVFVRIRILQLHRDRCIRMEDNCIVLFFSRCTCKTFQIFKLNDAIAEVISTNFFLCENFRFGFVNELLTGNELERVNE